MYSRLCYANVLVAMLVFAANARAQSVEGLLQKGVYPEGTAGDLNVAVTIYRKIVAPIK
jgi:hypothetical protein